MGQGQIRLLLVSKNPTLNAEIPTILEHVEPGQFVVSCVENLQAAHVHLGHDDLDAVILDFDIPETARVLAIQKLCRFIGLHGPALLVVSTLEDATSIAATQHDCVLYSLITGEYTGFMLTQTIRMAIQHRNRRLLDETWHEDPQTSINTAMKVMASSRRSSMERDTPMATAVDASAVATAVLGTKVESLIAAVSDMRDDMRRFTPLVAKYTAMEKFVKRNRRDINKIKSQLGDGLNSIPTRLSSLENERREREDRITTHKKTAREMLVQISPTLFMWAAAATAGAIVWIWNTVHPSNKK